MRINPPNGFTLVELLVAITLLSLVGLIMLGGMKFGTRVWERTETIADDAERVEAAQRYLRQQLSTIYPARQADGPNKGHVVFEGMAQSLRFVGPLPPQLGPASNSEFHIERTPDDALDVAWKAVQSLNSSALPTHAALLNGVASVEFAYFGPDPAGRAPQWWGNWADRMELPKAIRVRITFPPGKRGVWPELIAHPEVTVDVTCVYDPISRGCRGR